MAAARSDGLSWDRIGRAFCMTRQGARSRLDSPATGQEDPLIQASCGRYTELAKA
ncbi:hypothetical protein ARUE_c36200 [Arthrobacter sp. Rue61a]|nr:hypothetical protein ARUE_c36200 [Arthrobacter sp. Rue61a]